MQNFSHTIWMGDLETYMDEVFIKRAFETLGEGVVSVKVIRNKATGQSLGYGFVEFANATSARDAMLKLNGKPIPGVPTRRFKLNHASYGKDSSSSNEFSLFVGELTEDVDDLALFNSFKKYVSCRSAKVVMNNGKSRGYGFVRFMSESDQDKALIEMQNYCGLGYKPIRVSLAIPKRYNADGSLIAGATAETSTSVVPTGMPDPFTAAVAAAVTGSSAAQAEYYQAYQQYYQQYYASQYAAQFYPQSSDASVTSAGVGTPGMDTMSTTTCGSDAAGTVTSIYGPNLPHHLLQKQQINQGYVKTNAAPQEYAPEPCVLSSAFDRPRHVDDLDEVFHYLEGSRWHFSDPSLGLLLRIRP